MNKLNNCKSVSIAHRSTGEIRTYHINSDGTQVFTEKADGTIYQNKISSTQHGYKLVNFNTKREDGKNANHALYISQLVWAAWVNAGVYLLPNGFDIDHIDDNNQNNNFTNLQRITKQANLKKKTRRKARAKAIQAELVVLPCGDITFEPMEDAA